MLLLLTGHRTKDQLTAVVAVDVQSDFSWLVMLTERTCLQQICCAARCTRTSTVQRCPWPQPCIKVLDCSTTKAWFCFKLLCFMYI
jgi:hypothetical protein